VLLVLLPLLTVHAARSGLSSLFATSASLSNRIETANQGVQLNTGNPDAHYVRATILQVSDLPAAIKDYSQAATTRPDDYVLWLSLARAYELNGEVAAAATAARQAIPLAPAYAEPHYQLGNILVRAGQTQEGFQELQLAAASNPTLFHGIIDLAWSLSAKDPAVLLRSINPKNAGDYLELARYFRQRKEAKLAVDMYAEAGDLGPNERRSYVNELISTKKFEEAERLWKHAHPDAAGSGSMFDGGFERESDLSEPGFGWRVGERVEGFDLKLDPTDPREGRASLRIEFSGHSDPMSTILGQLITVEPLTNYRLRFAMRSEKLISGGGPLLVLTDATSEKVLSASEQFPNATDGWRDYSIDFATEAGTVALQITLRRNCATSPCPIFGRLWLDNFSLQKL
jgi:tetratricopeptide (TPR) repeat protein